MEDFWWVTNDTRTFMSRGYLVEGETVEGRCRQIADLLADYMSDKTIGDKLYKYLAKGYYSLSSPIWANFGRKRGLPISCNGSRIGDTIESIQYKNAEIGIMTKHGAGTSFYLGDLRPRGTPISTGGYADGPVHFSALYDLNIDVVSQGKIRRGNAAAYLDVTHPDIKEFLTIREEGSPIQRLSIGVCITDAWMEEMLAGDADKREIWALIIKKRFETGYPYLFFTDSANRGAPDVYRNTGAKIVASNLCTEIMLPSTEEESFVCDLSSMNFLTVEEWCGTDAVEILVYLLDAVMEEYITKTENIRFMEAAHLFAKNHRALGIGTLGYHSYLQSKGLAFESFNARYINASVHKLISDKAYSASRYLARKFGEPEVLKGYGRRNTTLMAIAPTTSSSFILGQVSQSIEPLTSNYFTKDLAKGKFTYKNPYLQDLLDSKGMNTTEVWNSILTKGGSVQHLDFLSEDEKAVFKTFAEIQPMEILQQAAVRQSYIDQGQSLNLMIPHDAEARAVHTLLVEAWKLGLKSIYYQLSSNPVQQLVRDLTACSACEG